jgi:hypothetical protein
MYPHPYLMQMVAEEHTKSMRSTAAAVTLARKARRARREAAHAAAGAHSASGLLRTIPQPRESEEALAHRAA